MTWQSNSYYAEFISASLAKDPETSEVMTIIFLDPVSKLALLHGSNFSCHCEEKRGFDEASSKK